MVPLPGLLDTYRFGYDQFRWGSGFSPVEQEVVLLAISRFRGRGYRVAARSAVADRGKFDTPADDGFAYRSWTPGVT